MKRKTIKDTPVKERKIGVVLEHIDSKLDLLVEGQQTPDQRMDRLEERIDGLDAKVDKLDVNFQSFRIEVNQKFEVITDELHLIRNDLKEKVSRDEFIVMEKRLAHLEKEISQLKK